MPDGTVILTSPSGHTYTTDAHGAAMFPTLAQPTGELDIVPQELLPDTDRSAMMPRRKHTRENGTHRRTTPPTPSLAHRHLPTTTVLK
jgi:hypothetical protein